MPTLTIDLTAQQAQRAQAAFATPENPAPTMADFEAWVWRQLRARVLQHERREAEAALAQPAPFDPT